MDLNATFTALNAGLPEDIERLAAAGFCDEAVALIDARLAEDWRATQNRPAYQGLSEEGLTVAQNPVEQAPDVQRAALIAHREILRHLPAAYPLSEAEAIARVQALIPDFTAEEFRAMVADNQIDWRFINGKKQYGGRFLSNLLDTDAAFAARAGRPISGATNALRDRAIGIMQQKGEMTARITLKAEIWPEDEAFAAAMARAKAAGKNTVTAKVWLPLPADCPSQSEIELLGFSQPPTCIAPVDAAQRTVYWEVELTENRRFTAEYRYLQCARYHDPLTGAAQAQLPPECADYLGEQAPHIVFTPYLKALVAQLTDGVAEPARKAKRIYDFITCNVHYRYQPPYFVLQHIADNCVRSRRGDCGIMALAFITMCRIAGIPARWESGLAVQPDHAGCHDWARFYIAPLGWLYADCSYGSSAARNGAEQRRCHYFGNLDPYRMVANHAFQAQLTPPKHTWRADPYDNQSGEIELEGVGLYGCDFDVKRTVEEFKEL